MDSSRVPASISLASWLDRLGQPSGAPGGGAASAVMLGLSAALLRMVAGYSSDDARIAQCRRQLSELSVDALEGSEADGVQSAELGAALALNARDPARDERVARAAIAAAQSSADLGEVGVPLRDVLRLLADIGNPALAVDLAVAAQALVAGTAAASINLHSDLRLARAHDVEDRHGEDLRALDVAAERLVGLHRDAQALADVLAAAFAHG
ncbi:hypothetical protein GH740_01265 [Microbacterium sp. SYP-A9085]|uniref:cyclodeaminase/cyclohydrolase family protein n=1 Tax=Microbacterium sp. SYP-A9085 TaxID=2664454 RepID=UPI00129B3679|nr:cyclodeaminase/cyclohydrolase family protein [Microbacterium sp. SYP-A9085]MRH27945.1 hypothetical protein [Microbacterium sp. SYP-A9085]